MSDKDKVSNDEFAIGHLGNPIDPDALVIQIPIKKYASDTVDGLDLAVGKCRRVESIVVMMIKQKMMKNKKAGLISPNVV